MVELKLPAMRGRMGGKIYYVSMIRIKNLANLFDTYLEKKQDQAERGLSIDLHEEAQRRMNMKRIPGISEYIHLSFRDNKPCSYVFNSITANSDTNLKFKPFKSGTDIGELVVTDLEKFTVADGQHRLMGIKRAYYEMEPKTRKVFGEESIAVVFFDVRHPKTGKPNIQRMHQIFTDLNRSAQKVSGSVVVAMGNEPVEVMTRRLVADMPQLHGLVEMERTNPTLKSPQIFSYKSISDSVRILTGNISDRKDLEEKWPMVKDIWSKLIISMPLWEQAKRQEIDPAIIKTKYVCSHAIVLRALSLILVKILTMQQGKKSDYLKRISEIDWKKSNPLFKKTILQENGGIINNKTAERQLVKALGSHIGLDLNDEE